jgi:ribonuclease PH
MLTGEIHGDARKTRQSSEDNDDHSEDKWHGRTSYIPEFINQKLVRQITLSKFKRNIICLILNVLCWTQTNYPEKDLGWPSNIHPAAANIL